jgi:hypothetical protein
MMKLAHLSLPAIALASSFPLEERQGTAQLISIGAVGDGCPPGSFSTDVAGISAVVTFDKFSTTAGNGVPATNQSLYCDVFVTVSFPGACKQAVMKTQTDGYVLLAGDAGATAVVTTQFHFTGGTSGASPPDLVYASEPGPHKEVDIGRLWDMDISATGTEGTFNANLGVFLNAPNAVFASAAILDKLVVVISQNGLC